MQSEKFAEKDYIWVEINLLILRCFPKPEPMKATVKFFLFLALTATRGLPAFSAGNPLQADTLNPGIVISNLAPVVINGGEWEFNLFNTLSTLKLRDMNDPDGVARSSRLDQIGRVWYNPFQSNFINFGLELRAAHQVLDADETSGPFGVFNDEAIHSLGSIGLGARLKPVRTLPEFNIQTSLTFPVEGDAFTRQQLGFDRTAWTVQGVFYQQFQPWLYVFATAGAVYQFRNEDRDQTSLTIPAGLYFVTVLKERKWYLIPSLSYASSLNYIKADSGFTRVRTSFLYGVSVQFLPADAWSIGLSLDRSIKEGPSNAPLRIVKGSYNQISLGVRYLLK